jgi:hypothetical protein
MLFLFVITYTLFGPNFNILFNSFHINIYVLQKVMNIFCPVIVSVAQQAAESRVLLS